MQILWKPDKEGNSTHNLSILGLYQNVNKHKFNTIILHIDFPISDWLLQDVKIYGGYYMAMSMRSLIEVDSWLQTIWAFFCQITMFWCKIGLQKQHKNCLPFPGFYVDSMLVFDKCLPRYDINILFIAILLKNISVNECYIQYIFESSMLLSMLDYVFDEWRLFIRPFYLVKNFQGLLASVC